MSSKTRLTPTEAIFVAEYLSNGRNQTQAYRRAYPKCQSDGAASVGGNRLLKRPRISVILESSNQKVIDTAASYAGIDKAYIMESLNKNLQRAMQAEPVLDREGNETGEYVYQGNVVNRAAELMGKEIGMFVNRIADPNGNPLPTPETRVYLSGIDFTAIVAAAKKAKG